MMSRSAVTPSAPEKAWLFGFPVDLISPSQGLAEVQAVLDAAEPLPAVHVVTLNPEMIMQAGQDAELERILKQAGLVIPDGAGVVWALKKYGHKETRRLPGIEFSEALLGLAAEQGYRVALIGAKDEVLEQAKAALQQRYSGLKVVYAHHGFFKGEVISAGIAQACAETRPQLVFVALGVPRQEKWIDQFRELFPNAALVGVGGSLDVWSGTTKRAPAWMRQLNLEWLYRITSEPWRIQRIYKTLPMFAIKVLLTPHGATEGSPRP